MRVFSASTFSPGGFPLTPRLGRPLFPWDERADKRNAWAACGLPITTIAVCAGFFSKMELIATIGDQEIPVFFEHDLDHVGAFLKDRTYYESPWKPSELFPEVPREKTRKVLASFRKAKGTASDESDEKS